MRYVIIYIAVLLNCIWGTAFAALNTSNLKPRLNRINPQQAAGLGRDLSEKLLLYYEMSLTEEDRRQAFQVKSNKGGKLTLPDIFPIVSEWLEENLIVRETVTETETFFRRTTLTETMTKTVFVASHNQVPLGAPTATITETVNGNGDVLFITLIEDPVTLLSPTIQYISTVPSEGIFLTNPGDACVPIFLTEEPVTRTIFMKPDVSTATPEAVILTEEPVTTTIALPPITSFMPTILTTSFVETLVPPISTLHQSVLVTSYLTYTPPPRYIVTHRTWTRTQLATLIQTMHNTVVIPPLISTVSAAAVTETIVPPPVTETLSPSPITESLTVVITQSTSVDPLTETIFARPVTETILADPLIETILAPPVTKTVLALPITKTLFHATFITETVVRAPVTATFLVTPITKTILSIAQPVSETLISLPPSETIPFIRTSTTSLPRVFPIRSVHFY
jgi:hypothetical protein